MNDPAKMYERYLADIADVAQCLWDKGWAEGNAGNISVHTAGENHILITGANTRMREIARSPEKYVCLVKVNEETKETRITGIGNEPSGIKPTSELPTHLLLHRFLQANNRPENAIVHTHCTELIALTHLKQMSSEESINRILYNMHPEMNMLIPEGIGFIPFITPGTERIAKATLEKFAERRVVIWEKHGVFAIGKDCNQAFDLIDIAAKAASIFLMVKCAGYDPEGFSDV